MPGTQPREFLAPTGVSMEEDVEKEVEEEAEVWVGEGMYSSMCVCFFNMGFGV